jgi:hypothetical protein
MKTVLIFLVSLAVILGIFTYFAVFGNASGTYAVNPEPTSSSSYSVTSTVLILPTTTASSSGSLMTDNASGSAATADTETYGSSFTTPALTWPEGQAQISITALSLQGTQLAFTLSVQTGAAPECVPLNLRLVADEEGDLDPPSPAAFSFPDTGNCNGTPNETYANQPATFTVDPTAMPLLFTTGGASNIFFEIATTTGNGLNVLFPGTSD